VYRRLSFVVAVFGLSILLVVGVLALITLVLWPSEVTALASVNERGQDVLRVSCEACQDGSMVSVGGASAAVVSRVAEVVLVKPLELGDNKLVVHIDRRGEGRNRKVELVVPVLYRVRLDMADLSSDPVVVHLDFETFPDTPIVVDGSAMQTDHQGRARHAADFTEACSGPSSEVARITRDIPYSIRIKGSAEKSGTVPVSFAVTPLVLHAPKHRLVVESTDFVIAGRTLGEASVTTSMGGVQIQPTSAGTFDSKMRIQRAGEAQIRVRASMPGHASRSVGFTIKRVESLRDEGLLFSQRAKLTLRELLENPQEHRDEEIVIKGEVLDVRNYENASSILLGASGGCSPEPCLIRVSYPGLDRVERGSMIRVFGRVASGSSSHSDSGGGHRGGSEPRINAEFILKAKQ